MFNAILASRSPPHLKAVFEQYKNISQMDIEGAIKDETSGNLCKAFLAVGMGLSAFLITFLRFSIVNLSSIRFQLEMVDE